MCPTQGGRSLEIPKVHASMAASLPGGLTASSSVGCHYSLRGASSENGPVKGLFLHQWS